MDRTNNNMGGVKFFKMYVDEPDNWEELAEDQVINLTEGVGYYKPDTVINTLKTGYSLRTPFAIYKAEPFYSARIELDAGVNNG